MAISSDAQISGMQAEIAVKVVDCDVHPALPLAQLVDYVPEPWRSKYFGRYAAEVESGTPLIYQPPAPERVDAIAPGDEVPGSDPNFVEKQLFTDFGVDYAILILLSPRPKVVNPAFETAMCIAHNDWLADTWLSKYNWHGRYRGSIRVCPADPQGAVREIERWAGHPHVVQVLMFPESSEAFGMPQFEPIFEAAARNQLPVAMHIISQVGMRTLTPVGFPSYWNEVCTAYPLVYMGHLASLVFNGVFQRVTNLRVVCVEGGFSWLTPFMWRLDRHWRELGAEVPQITRLPSEYIKEQVRLTTQPLEDPVHLQDLHRLMEWMGASEMLMLASDYPHYDAELPSWTIPRLPRTMRRQILCENAIQLYGLPHTRPHDILDGPT